MRPDDFRGLTNLVFLNLDANMIAALPDGIFDDLISLQTLLISGNYVAQLGPNVFGNLRSLQWLHLDGNCLSKVAAAPFAPLQNIVGMCVCRDALAFRARPHSHRSYLHQNAIETVEPGALADIASLAIAYAASATVRPRRGSARFSHAHSPPPAAR